MALSHRTDIVPVGEVVNTKEMTLKILISRKQECKSRIMKAKQEIEDLQVARFAELEYQILQAEQELSKLIEHEKIVISSIESQ